MMASPRHAYRKQANNLHLPFRAESREAAKKRVSPLTVAIQRWWIKFSIHTLPVRIGIVALAGLVLLSVLMLHRSSSSTTTTAFVTDHKSHPYNTIALPADPEKLKHRPHLAGASRRIVSLLNADVTQVAEEVPSSLPEPGAHSLVERYNPIPQNMPALKAASGMDRGKCQRIADWQIGHNPTCNSIHEATWGWDHVYGDIHDLDLLGDEDDDTYEQSRLVAGGAFRHVWKIREFDGTKRALKTLRAGKSKEYDLRNFDRHRRDAVAMERLTGSPLVVDIYGYCTNSALFDWGEGGDLLSIFERDPNISKDELLKIAYNATLSIAHAHHFDERGRPTMAHTDIKPDQFLYQGGYYRLTDFNRVRFLMWNEDKNLQCGFTVGKNGGVWRSPEEYNYQIETEKVDVYSLGNVLYFLLTRQMPWKDIPTKEVYELVMHKKRPKIPKRIQESEHPFDVYMIQAMEMAWTHVYAERPGALEISKKLQEGIDLL